MNSEKQAPETKIDVKFIMSEIQRCLKRDILLDDVELEKLQQEQIETIIQKADIPEDLKKLFTKKFDLWNIRPNYQVHSHRPVVGSIIVVIKKLLSPLIRLYTDFLIYRQSYINRVFFEMLKELSDRNTLLDQKISHLQKRIQEISPDQEPPS